MRGKKEMRKNTKQFAFFILLLVLVVTLPMTALANSPAPQDHLTVYLNNLPQNAVYADLLIKMDPTDTQYVDFQFGDYENNKEKINQIADYSVDGFVSFTIHYNNAKSNIKIENDNNEIYKVTFCKGLQHDEFITQYEDLLVNYPVLKIAILDKDYNIITVSDEVKIPQEKYIRFYDHIDYDVKANEITANAGVNPYYFLFTGFFSLVIMFSSIIIEVIVAALFKIKGKKLLTVLIVNTCTQVLMRVLYMIVPLGYVIETIIFEILVYGSEFLIYKKYFKDKKASTILIYTVVANTISLILGILLDCYILV